MESILKNLLCLLFFAALLSFQGCSPKPQDVVKKYLEAKTPDERIQYMVNQDDFHRMMIRNQGQIQYNSISNSPRVLRDNMVIVDCEVVQDRQSIPTFYILRNEGGDYKIDLSETIGLGSMINSLQLTQAEAEQRFYKKTTNN